jgi:phosphotransferase system enzyme I (PtsI)
LKLEEQIKGKAKAILRGIPASSGIVINKAYVIKQEPFVNKEKIIKKSDIPYEINRYLNSQNNLIEELKNAIDKVPKNALDLISILQADLMMLEDEIFSKEVIDFIRKGNSAESSIINQFEKHISLLRRSSDEIFRDRIIELDNFEKRFLRHLSQKEKIFDIPEERIVVAQRLMPTELVTLLEKNVQAIITEGGGITSHLAILARSYSIPAVFSVNFATNLIRNDELLIIDAYSGKIFIKPDKELLNDYLNKFDQIRKYKEKLGKIIDLPTVTQDGKEVTLWANVNSLDDVKQAIVVNAKGLGLVRTESLLMELGRIPNEEEQVNYYNQIAETAFPLIVTLRAFDIGSDKYLDNIIEKEDNPALGFRGIRLLLSRKDIFKTQIRAILRASKNKNVRFMLPMITSIEEVVQTIEIINQCKEELLNEGIIFDDNLPLGVMIETPAAALISDELSQITNFFSIGTNDLTQYILAADRTNELLSEYFNNFHPGVLRLMEFTINAAHRNNIPVAVCGEMAGHPLATELLLGMGVDELSMAPSLLLEVKEKILSLNYNDSRETSMKIMKSAKVKEIFQSISY